MGIEQNLEALLPPSSMGDRKFGWLSEPRTSRVGRNCDGIWPYVQNITSPWGPDREGEGK